jgi:3-hydroxyacyl-CoA dehydrogenase
MRTEDREHVDEHAILASNTSSIPIAAAELHAGVDVLAGAT